MSYCSPKSDSDIKIECDNLASEGERFKAFEENFIPLELDHMKDNYRMIIQKLIKKAKSLVKYYNIYKEIQKQLNLEAEEMTLLESEIKSLEHAQQRNHEIATQAITYIKNLKKEYMQGLASLPQETAFLMLPFKAFFELGPKDTQGIADLSWKAVKDLIMDRERLCKMMTEMFDERVKDISLIEVELAEKFIRQFNREYSHDDSIILLFSKAMINFAISCVSSCDILKSIQSRQELLDIKREKFSSMKKELQCYDSAADASEHSFEEILQKLTKSKSEFEELARESEQTQELLTQFEKNYKAIEKERGKERKNVDHIEKLLCELNEEKEELNSMKMKAFHSLPPDTEMA